MIRLDSAYLFFFPFDDAKRCPLSDAARTLATADGAGATSKLRAAQQSSGADKGRKFKKLRQRMAQAISQAKAETAVSGAPLF